MSPPPLFTLCVLASLLSGGCGKPGTSVPGSPADPPSRPVQLARVVSRPMERWVTATGSLLAHEQSVLSAKVPGRLREVTVDIGSLVKTGDLLAQVEPRDYELRVEEAGAALSQARAELGLPLDGDDDQVTLEHLSSVRQARAVLDEATGNRERVQQLLESGIASASESDSVEATHAVAKSRYDAALDQARTRLAALGQRRIELEIARKQLADTRILAPFDGAVQARLAGVGEYVAAGIPVLRLVETNPLRLRLEVPERDSVQVRVGQRVVATAEGESAVHEGSLARLSPAINESNRMLVVEADVPNRGDLRPGLFARARIIVNPNDPGLSIPADCLVTFAGIEKVVTVREGRAIERTVRTGRRGPDWIEVLDGLTEGEEVVVNPAGLRTGQPVTFGNAVEPTPKNESEPASQVVPRQ
ncbi:MAG: efflux RND transporter periplasmic adaptor subunit [Verrucomicrobiales bacterium]|nr:efflux RND transporter periplasmic adaptor subunit [Verrucomicrobiales bacterium]